MNNEAKPPLHALTNNPNDLTMLHNLQGNPSFKSQPPKTKEMTLSTTSTQFYIFDKFSKTFTIGSVGG